MKKLVLVLLLIGSGAAVAHTDNHREVVLVERTGFCPEDARLVPVRHHGYRPESVSGWVYTCKNFDEKGKWAP